MISNIKGGRASVSQQGKMTYLSMSDTDRSDRSGYRISALRRSGVPVQRGKINVEKFGGFEEMPGVFAGGDCATGPSTVISAIAAGKVIAANIDEYLGISS